MIRKSILVIIHSVDIQSATSGRAQILYKLLKPYVDGVVITVAKNQILPLKETVRNCKIISVRDFDRYCVIVAIIIDELFQDTEYIVLRSDHKNVFILEAGDINHDKSKDEPKADNILRIIDHLKDNEDLSNYQHFLIGNHIKSKI